MKNLSRKLKDLRKKRGYSLDRLGMLAGVSKSYLWELENKDSLTPSAIKLSAISDALEISIYYFIDDQPNLDEEENNLDAAFYRSYLELEPVNKRRVRKILSLFQQTD